MFFVCWDVLAENIFLKLPKGVVVGLGLHAFISVESYAVGEDRVHTAANVGLINKMLGN